MKKIIYLQLILPLLVASCEINPEAYFSATPGDPVVGEEVLFSNNSLNADRFEWDFGDGYISNEFHPVHIYTASGTFQVILTAWSENGLTDKASLDIEVRIPTLLEIEVLEYFNKYPVEDASVILYPTIYDWDNETNIISEGFTDSDGKVVFADLDKKVYYVDVWETNHDNYALREEDPGFIRTSEIIPHKINRFIAYVDYVDHGKSAGRRSGNMIIRKFERKAIDMQQPEPSSDINGWQELYNRRVISK